MIRFGVVRGVVFPLLAFSCLAAGPQTIFDRTFGGSGVSTVAGLARDSQGALYVVGTTNSSDFATVNPLQSHLGAGPLVVTADAGKTFTYPAVGIATSVNAMAASPSMPLVVYAATPVGIYKSADGGTTWSTAANAGLTSAVTALAVDATAPNTIYAGTHQGVFISTNAGANWQVAGSGLPRTGISAIAANPSRGGIVFVSVPSSPAVFRTTDSGQSWIQVPAGPSAVEAITAIANGVVMAATATDLEISTDGGTTWTEGATQGVLSNHSFAIASGSPNTVYLINSLGVQRSTDGGKTFSVVLAVVQTSSAGVAADPRTPSTVYVADYNLLYRSTDAGQTWTKLTLPRALFPQAPFISPADSRVVLAAGTPGSVFVTKWSADGSQMLYSTYLGGSGGDRANAIAVDSTGSAYVTGSTSSTDFPTTTGAYQTKLNGASNVFVAKLSTDGSKLVYSTLLGTTATPSRLLGTQAPGPYGIAVDSGGNAVITGFTGGNFPVTANASQGVPMPGCYLSPAPSTPTGGTAFVAKIAASGNALVYSTLLGGTCATFGTGVALDANGNAWVVGGTLSPDFPVTSDALQRKAGGGLYDGFLARFSPTGGLDYASYLGGPGYDVLNAIAVDSAGAIYVTGESGGLFQPASTGAFQPQAGGSCLAFSIGPSEFSPQGNAVVAKLDATAHSVERLTYFGGPSCLFGSAIAVDSSGAPWISGPLVGATLQTANPIEIGIGRGYVSKFSADFTQLQFSTYFDAPAGLALDSSGLAYLAGTLSFDNVTMSEQAYIAKIDPTPAAISLDGIMMSVVPVLSGPGFEGIASGEVLRIVGKQMGPASATPGVIQAGVLATNVAGVEVTFDGTAVPLLSVSAQEIDLIAPFALTGKSSTTIQVHYQGVASNAVPVAVTGTALEVLGVFNADFTLNSAGNPAPAGSMLSLYLAGAGQTNPPSEDGHVNVAPLAAPGKTIQLQWFNGGSSAMLPVSFAGAAPGLVAGILQVNFVAPQPGPMIVQLLVGDPYQQGSSVPFNVFVK